MGVSSKHLHARRHKTSADLRSAYEGPLPVDIFVDILAQASSSNIFAPQVLARISAVYPAKILYFRGALLLYTMAEPACSGTTLLYVCKQCRMSYCGLAAHRVLDEGACRQCFYLSKAAANDPSLAIGSSAAGDPSPAIGSSAAGGHPNFVEAPPGLGPAIPNMRKSRAQAVFA